MGHVAHPIWWSYIVSPFKQCLLGRGEGLVFFNIVKLFCVGFANASMLVFFGNNTCICVQPPIHGWED